MAGYTVIYALTEPELKSNGLTAFVVKKDMPSLSIGKIEDKMGIRSVQVLELVLDHVRVPKENLITEQGAGFKLAMKTLDGGRIGVAAQGLGNAEGAFEIEREYLMAREQFGKLIFRNQYLAFKMAELEIEIVSAKYLLYKAACDKDAGKPYSNSAAKAKYACTNTAMHVITEAIQFLGGNGNMKGYHVERMMRDAKLRKYKKVRRNTAAGSERLNLQVKYSY